MTTNHGLVTLKRLKVVAIIVAINIFVISVIYISAEMLFSRINKRDKMNYSYLSNGREVSFFVFDANLKYKPLPSSDVEVIKTIKGKEIYHPVYSIDGYSRRITPVENREIRNKYVLFFGCSFVFGEGLNDDQTLPYYFSQNAPGYMPYNYGFIGYGTQHMLARLSDDDTRKQVPEKQGILIYLFIDDHVCRAAGTLRVRSWAKGPLLYYMDKDGNITKNPGSGTRNTFWVSVFDTMNKSQTISYIERKYPSLDIPPIGDREIYLAFRIIEESRNNYRKDFNNDAFYVVFFPGSKYSSSLIPYLNKAGIKYFDYSSLLDYFHNDRYWVSPLDYHPGPRINSVLAKTLAKDLNIYGSER